jgi:hypothetical protein
VGSQRVTVEMRRTVAGLFVSVDGVVDSNLAS